MSEFDYRSANPRIIKALRYYAQKLNSLVENHGFDEMLLKDIEKSAEV